jgi:omega-3 fatty acid desaturase (delta-15 desaturase)
MVASEASIHEVCPDSDLVDVNANLTKSIPKALPTYEELRNAIPKQCFEKSLPISIAYLVWDFAVLAGLYMIVGYVEHYTGWMGLLVWYYITGMFMSSLFIIGHDCGHTTFSNYPWVNDLFGHIAHAPIMAPYWPWKKSHQQHHKYTSHLEKDRGHPWVTESDYFKSPWLMRNFCKLPFSGLFRYG